MLTIMMLPLAASCGDDNDTADKDVENNNILEKVWVLVDNQ